MQAQQEGSPYQSYTSPDTTGNNDKEDGLVDKGEGKPLETIDEERSEEME